MPFYGGSVGSGIFQGQRNQADLEAVRVQTAQALQRMAIEKSLSDSESAARQRALAVQQNQGAIFGNMYPAQPPGLPPPPSGTPQGGPMPPGPGVSSLPQPPPMPQMSAPGGAAPMPQMQAPGNAIPMPPPQASAAPAPQAAPPGPPPPYQPVPSAPPAPPTPQQGMPPPPAAPQPPPNTVTAGPQQGSVFMERFVQAMRQSGIPQDQWGAQLAGLPPIVKESIAEEIRMRDAAQKALVDQANLIIKQRDLERKTTEGERKGDQADRKLDQGDVRLQNAAAKLGIDQQRVDVMKQKLKDAENNDNASFDEKDVAYWTEVVKSGGNLLPGLARTNGGRKLIQQVMKGVAGGGIAPSEMLANQAEFQGLKAGERTLGTRSSNIEMAATEAASLADLALLASNSVPRTNITKANEWIQLFDKGTSDPELRAFVAANTSLVNAYARAINPQGVGTVADKEHAREMLGTAFPKGDYQAAVNQLLQEIVAAKKSPGTVKGEMRERFTAPSGRQVAPPEAVEELRKNPALKADFSKKFGYLPADAR